MPARCSSRISLPGRIRRTGCRCDLSLPTPGTPSSFATCSSARCRQSWRNFVPASPFCTLPSFQADPARHGTRSGTFIVLNFAKRVVLIGGTRYAGEIKKSIFTALNYLLPSQGVLPMHCSANSGPAGDTALFFGLSGTGKTTLSADPSRQLIGDDEHGWSDRGVFNFEGGCYAKVIRLRPDTEPEIYAATQMFGTVLENVVLDPAHPARRLRCRHADREHPRLLPHRLHPQPSAQRRGWPPEEHRVPDRRRLRRACLRSPGSRAEQAMYHFLSGYTAKVAGTERGVTEPSATFSACFGAPFLPLHPGVYAAMLGERIARHKVKVWLVNTGWTGGSLRRRDPDEARPHPDHGAGGAVRRAGQGQVRAGSGFRIRSSGKVQGVPTELLSPRKTWSDPAAYDAQARKLAAMFRENFEQYRADVPSSVAAAGPV